MALVASALTVSACSISADVPPPVVKTVYVEREVPAVAKQKCAEPVKVPFRRLSEAETRAALLTDGHSLRVCEARRAAAVGGDNVQ